MRALVCGILMFLSFDAVAKTYEAIGLKIEGANRTRASWVETYLALEFPMYLTESHLVAFEKKLLTTQVFTKVAASFFQVPGDPESHFLVVELEEKWTTIPVVRGAFGGGTPLVVAGIYDTHSFGRLWTLGTEARRYGQAPWGWVSWARAPRFLQGQHVLGFEMWRQFRERAIYDENDKRLGIFRSDWSMARALFMSPVGLFRNIKYGLDLRYRQEAPNRYVLDEDASTEEIPEGIRISQQRSKQVSGLFRLVYDDVQINNLIHDGARLSVFGGPLVESGGTASQFEHELFYYKYYRRSRINLAVHYLLGQTTTDSLENQYFLGGFESIRGIPDGAIYGTRASYFNVELRQATFKSKYMWLQNVVFADAGGAGQTWQEHADNYRSTVGVGARISVPQVYRLMFRIDYAWSLDEPGTHGLTAGMNQFFQPYKPL